MEERLLLDEYEKVGKLIRVLDDGFVRYVAHMGDDAAIVQAARVSYGIGTKQVSDDRNLIRYLMRHTHTTPFEMVELKFHVRIPMDAHRQFVRHRMASINEYSTRYSEAIDSAFTTAPDTWRVQDQSNKQGSGGFVSTWPEPFNEVDQAHHGTPGNYLSKKEKMFQRHARDIYEERLKFGVAREQARKDLPLSTYTELYWKIDLHNLFHFLRLRMDSHAQWEIRQYANAIAKLTQPIVPIAWEAFNDYRLNSITLSSLDILLIKALPDLKTPWEEAADGMGMAKRERKEFTAKCEKLGIALTASTAGNSGST